MKPQRGASFYRYRFQDTVFSEREGYLSSSDVGLSAHVALLRHDSSKPNKSLDAGKSRTLLGAAYWFKAPREPLAAAVLADFEQVRYDAALARPDEKRYELKTLFNF